ncbi:FtsH protease regulator HflC [Bordetella hinzii]|nr:FtsH protease regulator HflC [Bordetella hinzii]KCB30925.1 SPFH domain/Band 7 family protein [Bordetella hinzii L60]KCB52039.1 SPFH domain/Band 7 family protein [Bordetella hinzii 1277]SNV70462.1 FtsH protease regulator HflC [Bordetella hinzii]
MANKEQLQAVAAQARGAVKWSVLALVVFVVILMITFGSWFQVDQGERGVVLRNGKIVSIAEPGLGFKMPVIDTVHTISVRDHTITFGGKGSAALEAYSYDQQPASLRVSITYQVPPEKVSELYSEYQTLGNLEQRVIERRTYDVIKNVFGKYTAASAIQQREKMGMDANAAMRAALQEVPVTVVSVQIEEVGFSKAYEDSIEKRMLAQVQIETTRQQKQTAEIQAEIQVVQAEAAAKARVAAFKAEADGIKLRGDAEAAAIEAKARALATNTNLVNLNAVEKWDGKLPETQVPGAALPFIGIK